MATVSEANLNSATTNPSDANLALERVAAIVVTRDRLNLLQRCLESLAAQTRRLDAIYVVDVDSSDDTPAFLRESATSEKYGALVVVTLSTNAGGAGGFHAGMKAAHEAGFDWLWCMDDDGYATPDALQKLLDFSRDSPSRWLNSLVVAIQDNTQLAFPLLLDGAPAQSTLEVQARGRCVPDASPFNGTLIHRRVVDEAGLPHPAFFIWGDEQEFKRRAGGAGAQIVTITDSIFYHPASGALPLPAVSLRHFWKYYYHVRNHEATATKDGQLRLSPRGAWKLGRHYITWLLANMVSNSVKILILLAAIAAAVFNNTKRYFPRDKK